MLGHRICRGRTEGKLEVTYNRNLYKSYMCVRAQEDVQEACEIHMLEKQAIPGLLPMQVTMAQGVQAYLYEISGKQQIGDYLTGRKIDYGILKGLLFSIQELCRILPDYLLREGGLCLEFPFIYVNLEDGSLYFTYLPFWDKNLPEAFQAFMEQVLREIDHQDKAAIDLGYQIYQMCTRENANIRKMLETVWGQGSLTELKQTEEVSPGKSEGTGREKPGDRKDGSNGKDKTNQGQKHAGYFGRDQYGGHKGEGRESHNWKEHLINKMGVYPYFFRESILSHFWKGDKEKKEFTLQGMIPWNRIQEEGISGKAVPLANQEKISKEGRTGRAVQRRKQEKTVGESMQWDGISRKAKKLAQKEKNIQEGMDWEGTIQEAVDMEDAIQEAVDRKGKIQKSMGREGVIQEFMHQGGIAQGSMDWEGEIQEVMQRKGIVQEVMQRKGIVQEVMHQGGIVQESMNQGGEIQEVIDREGIIQEAIDREGIIQEAMDGEEVSQEPMHREALTRKIMCSELFPEEFETKERTFEEPWRKEAQDERVRGIPRKLYEEKAGITPGRQLVRGIPKEYFEEEEPEDTGVRGIPKEYLEEEEPEDTGVRGIPKEYLEEEEPEDTGVRGIPKEYSEEERQGEELEDTYVRGIPKEYFSGGSSQRERSREGAGQVLGGTIPGKKCCDRAAEGQERDFLQESLQVGERGEAEAWKQREGRGWLRRWKKKESIPLAGSCQRDASPNLSKEAPRYATEILADFGQQAEGILVYQGNHGCGDIVVDRAEFLVGKNEGQVNGIIDARGISRLHARIVLEGDAYYIEDLNSTNGTYLNGTPLVYHKKVKLCRDDHIRFGGEEYVFC